MKFSEVVVVTITLARTAEEERTLLTSLEKLSAFGVPMVVSDGGSSQRFVKELLKFSSHITSPKKKGLVEQVKAGLRTALLHFPDKRAILYTEPDKYPFFGKPMLEFIAQTRSSDRFGVAVAGRDPRSFQTFPEGQQRTEAFMNEAFSWIVGRKADYCYGPLLLSRRAAEMALNSPDDLGWGWRFWLMRRVVAARVRVVPIELNLPCPKEQRGEDSMKDRMYRLKQLKQNLDAISYLL